MRGLDGGMDIYKQHICRGEFHLSLASSLAAKARPASHSHPQFPGFLLPGHTCEQNLIPWHPLSTHLLLVHISLTAGHHEMLLQTVDENQTLQT